MFINSSTTLGRCPVHRLRGFLVANYSLEPFVAAATIIATDFSTSAFVLLGTDMGWVQGPLLGCLVSAITYFAVSCLSRKFQMGGRREVLTS